MHTALDWTTPESRQFFETLVAKTRNRVLWLVRRYQNDSAEPPAESASRAELWYTLHQHPNIHPDVAVVTTARRVRKQETPCKSYAGRPGGPQQGLSQYVPAPDHEVDTRLDSTRYLDVMRQACSPAEWELLHRRLVLDHSFDELAQASLGPTVAPEVQAREAARLRKQVQRLRERCRKAVQRRYPSARAGAVFAC